MGFLVQDLTKDMARIAILPPDGIMLWVVLRRAERKNLPVGWWIQGIGSDERHAIAMCRSEEYYIGPLPVNVALPEETKEWIGAYCPLAAINNDA